MSSVLRPSRESLQEAWKLGRQMAVYERRFRPDLTHAHHHSSYLLFQTAHRHRMETSPLFRQWDAKLQRIVERAARQCRLSQHDRRQWDQFYSGVGRTIHEVFWRAWEEAYQLERHYCARMAIEEEAQSRPTVLRVANRPASDAAAGEAAAERGELWDNVADKLFDEMKSDEDAQFWKLPAAESLGAKSSGLL